MSADDLNEMSEETLAVEAKKTSDKKKRLELSVGDRIVYVTQFGDQNKGKVKSVTTTKNGNRIYNVLYDDECSAGLLWSNRYLFKEGDVIPEDILNECSMEDDEEDYTTEEEEEEIPVLEREHLCANVDDIIEDDEVEVGMKRRASSEDDEDYPVLKRQLSSAE